jgi:hypothetical protein
MTIKTITTCDHCGATLTGGHVTLFASAPKINEAKEVDGMKHLCNLDCLDEYLKKLREEKQ